MENAFPCARMMCLRSDLDEIETELLKYDHDPAFVNERLNYLTYHITAVANELGDRKDARIDAADDIIPNM